MPFPSFSRPSPQPEGSPSRFSALQANVRSLVAGSSIYSQSAVPSTNTSPKVPFRGLFRRSSSPPALPLDASPSPDEPRVSDSSQSPLRPQHTAGSYQRAISHDVDEDGPTPPRPAHARNASYVDPETQYLADTIHGRRGRPKPRRPIRRAWVRKRTERGVCWSFIRSKAAKSKVIGCIISGLFLAVILTICMWTAHGCGLRMHLLTKNLRPLHRCHATRSRSGSPRTFHPRHPLHDYLLLSFFNTLVHVSHASTNRDASNTRHGRSKWFQTNPADSCPLGERRRGGRGYRRRSSQRRRQCSHTSPSIWPMEMQCGMYPSQYSTRSPTVNTLRSELTPTFSIGLAPTTWILHICRVWDSVQPTLARRVEIIDHRLLRQKSAKDLDHHPTSQRMV